LSDRHSDVSLGARPAIAANIAAAVVLILVLSVIPVPPKRTELADVPLKELEAFIDSNRSVDVATDDPTRVRAWLAQRVDFAPPPVARGSTQIELIGGRLCLFARRRVASYMYRVHGRLLSIYIMASDGLSPTGDLRIEHVGRTLLFSARWSSHPGRAGSRMV
jgi:anti-sigma factor RsiW